MLRCSGKLLSLRTPPGERYAPAGFAVTSNELLQRGRIPLKPD
nr:MAG TPA: Poxvirus DNA-directed RNA polymerase 19 kDa subunit [Caudoviricetes sp.]